MKSYFTNLSDPPKSLAAACSATGLSTSASGSFQADLVIWEASGAPSGQLTPQQAQQLTASIQSGRRLLFTLSGNPGDSPIAMSNVLPSSGWTTRTSRNQNSADVNLYVADWDRSFFPPEIENLAIPFSFDIRPTPASERGQARYERYSLTHPVLHTEIPAENTLWSRPLLNREWVARAWCNNVTRTPLLVTGRYGAGKVAMLSTSIFALKDTTVVRTFWDATLRWLGAADEPASAQQIMPELNASILNGKIHLALHNPSSTPLSAQIVIRTLSQEAAILPDQIGEQQKSITLAAKGNTTISLPLLSEQSDSTAYAKERLHVRVGILSANGDTLLQEERLIAPPAPLQISVRTDNLYSLTYPFHAPGPDTNPAFNGRMGATVNAYAYPPGATIRGSVLLSNGMENLATLAEVHDRTTPNNPSTMALNDEASAIRPGVADKIVAYSMWTGKVNVENEIEFSLPAGAHVAAVTLVGTFVGNAANHNPGQVLLEADGTQIASMDALDAVFQAGYGQVHLPFAPRMAQTLRVRFPWVPKKQSAQRLEPWLGEIRVLGWRTAPPAPIAGNLAISLVNALTNERHNIANQSVHLAGCAEMQVPFQLAVPGAHELQLFRIEAALNQTTASAPVLAIQPATTLLPETDAVPRDAPGVGLNVTVGFRIVYKTGTGTSEPHGGWASIDDLVWAYSRQFREIPAHLHSNAGRLYLADTDMTHYSTPWASFSNGELFMPEAAPLLVDFLKQTPQWTHSNIAHIQFADRWDDGPDPWWLHGWPDLVEFDRFLRESHVGSLQGRTHTEVSQEIDAKYQGEWFKWHLQRYLQSIRALRSSFLAAGKTLVITSQCIPMVIGDAGKEIAQTIVCLHDDSTWSMVDASPVLTTGRQISELAFNSALKMSTVLAWGFNSPVLNNWQWHCPVGTTEPTRRLLYDRAWRAMLSPERKYSSVYTYGYTSNVGTAFTLTENDYQQWWYAQERHSLLYPEAPVGAGLILSTAPLELPGQMRYTNGDPLSLDEARQLAVTFRNLHNAGVGISFTANAAYLDELTTNAPLILVNLRDFSDREIRTLQTLHARGVRMAAFASKAALSPAASNLFAQPGTILIETPGANLTPDAAQKAAEQLHAALQLPLRFPDGAAGYGFRCQNTSFIVLEDWLERSRTVTVEVAKSPGAAAAHACNANDHQNLAVRDNQHSWLVEVPLPSGDGVLIALKETSR